MPAHDGVRGVVLDFDGTLVQSVGIKDRAFAELYASSPDHLAEIIRYHLAHNHTIRFEKFRHIQERILGLPYTPQDEERLSRCFSRLVFERIVQCPAVAGAMEFLAAQQGIRPLFLVSASPAEELQRILEARGMLAFFRRVYAHPFTKTAAMRDILEREGLTSGQLLAVGDTPEDAQTAESCGVAFAGVDSGKWSGGEPFFVGADMDAVSRHLAQAAP